MLKHALTNKVTNDSVSPIMLTSKKCFDKKRQVSITKNLRLKKEIKSHVNRIVI